MPYDLERPPLETPTQRPGPFPWEAPDRSLPIRFFSTLRTTFAPLTMMRAVSAGPLAPAVRFALLWTLPWLLAWAVIPFTHTLEFGFDFSLQLRTRDQNAITYDVLRAMGIGLTLGTIAFLTWATPFASLLHAFGRSPEPEITPRTAAWRMVLYRAWLIPFCLTLLSVVGWSFSKEPDPNFVELAVLALHLVPRIIILMHCFAMARYFGIEGFNSVLVAVVPLLVEVAVGLVVDRGAQLLLPPRPGAQP